MADQSVVWGDSDTCPSTSGFSTTGSCCYQWSTDHKVWVLKTTDCTAGHKCQNPENMGLVGEYDGQYVRVCCVVE